MKNNLQIIFWIHIDFYMWIKEFFLNKNGIYNVYNVITLPVIERRKKEYDDKKYRLIKYKEYLIGVIGASKNRMMDKHICYKKISNIEKRIKCLIFNSTYVLEKFAKEINKVLAHASYLDSITHKRDLKIEEILK